jgi:hypothetical protein
MRQIIVVLQILITLRHQIRNNNYDEIENWLNEQKWFSHDSGIPHIKLFWLHVF